MATLHYRRLALQTSLLCGLAVAAAPAAGGDHFLTIGGGYSPSGNQVSLEKNVLMLRDILAEKYPGGAPHDILYSNGNDPAPDLQYKDPAYKIPRANVLLARVFNEEKGLNFRYRRHEIPGLRAEASREQLNRWFQETGRKLSSGDRLFIYVTSHGGRAEDAKHPYDTCFYMWDHEKVTVREFVEQLDKVPKSVPVVLVMVQCFSGGFSHVIFNGGETAKGVSGANRCGFFATVHDRKAAGCTVDIDAPNYQEYSTSFFAALRGKTRTGTPVPPPDYDGDGRVSLSEAHAYVILTSTTIDVPVKTSDAFLRAESRTTAKGRPGFASKKPTETLLTPGSAYATLREAASPVDRAVLDGLSKQLELSAPDRAAAARDLAAKIEREKKELGDRRRKVEARYGELREKIRAHLIDHYPELFNRWSPDAGRLLRRHTDEIAAFIESQSGYAEFDRLHGELDKFDTQNLDLERRSVKCQRLSWALESVALAANLPTVASSELQQRYARLLAAERGFLGPVPAPVATK